MLFLNIQGQGPLNQFLKLLVFGNEEPDTLGVIEEGDESEATTKPNGTAGEVKNGSAEAEIAELSTVQYCLRLIFCIVGLQGAYLTWGVLQVGIVL